MQFNEKKCNENNVSNTWEVENPKWKYYKKSRYIKSQLSDVLRYKMHNVLNVLKVGNDV